MAECGACRDGDHGECVMQPCGDCRVPEAHGIAEWIAGHVPTDEYEAEKERFDQAAILLRQALDLAGPVFALGLISVQPGMPTDELVAVMNSQSAGR